VGVLSLKNQKEFDYIKKYGYQNNSSWFIIVAAKSASCLKNYSENVTLLGLKVSRKFSKKAVIRNKARRRIRHLLNISIKEESLNLNGKGVIVIPKIGMDSADFKFVKRDFVKSLVNILSRIEPVVSFV
jgi:ribonuclease P protein component